MIADVATDTTIISIVALAVTSGLGGIGWFFKAVWSRLFAEESGYITRLVNKHIDFLSTIEQSIKKMTDAQEKQADSILGLGAAVKELGASVNRLDGKVTKLNEHLINEQENQAR